MERRHELLAEEAVDAGCVGWFTEIRAGMVDQLRRSVAQALASAEAAGLANRDERCLQSDMQRIRERLAAERAWDEGYKSGAADQSPKGKFSAFCCPNPYRLPKGPTDGKCSFKLESASRKKAGRK